MNLWVVSGGPPTMTYELMDTPRPKVSQCVTFFSEIGALCNSNILIANN